MTNSKRHLVEINRVPVQDDGEPLTQAERFRRVARELGADEDEAAFKAKLTQIARHKPADGKTGERPRRVGEKKE